MSARAVAWVLALTRAWLRCYTAGLPADLIEERCNEIESDLWEMQHDPAIGSPWRVGRTALCRVMAGMHHDIAWRMDHAGLQEQLLTRRLVAFSIAALVLLSSLAMPVAYFKGRREVASCARAITDHNSTAALRHDVIRCAGAFFTARQPETPR